MILRLALVLASLGLSLANQYLLAFGPEHVVKLQPALRWLSLGVPLGLTLLLRRPRAFMALAILGGAAQVQVLWLLCGQVFVPEQFWVTVGAVLWCWFARWDPLQAAIAGLVVLHGVVPGAVGRGGYALVGAAGLVAWLLGSIVWPGERD